MKLWNVMLGLALLTTIGWGGAVYAGQGAAIHAAAVLYNTAGTAIGEARLTEDAAGVVHITVHAKALSPGLHGTHIHAVGSCDATTTPVFSSAGGHFNPHGKHHGLENAMGAHGGDLPNLEVNSAGIGRLHMSTDLVTLRSGTDSLFDADGSAVVIHAGEDDQVSDPSGNSGGRIACGVLTR